MGRHDSRNIMTGRLHYWYITMGRHKFNAGTFMVERDKSRSIVTGRQSHYMFRICYCNLINWYLAMLLVVALHGTQYSYNVT